MTTELAQFSAVFIALYVGHQLGDHWIQTECQAFRKGERNARGRAACIGHVVTLQATKLMALAVLVLAVGLRFNGWALATGLLVDGVSHYWADRRFTLEAFAGRVGKGGFYTQGTDLVNGDGEVSPHTGTGKYLLDQTWHLGWLFVSAVLVVALPF